MFLIPGLVIAYHVASVEFPEEQRVELIRYLRNLETSKGGWGMYAPVYSLPNNLHICWSAHVSNAP